MDAQNRIILGSRGSELALAQVRMAETALRMARPDLEVVIEIIRTSGDEGRQRAAIVDRKAGRKGMFTREIEKELLAGRIDVAVHSAKDLPSEQRDELEVTATLRRANTDDVLVTKDGLGLTSVAAGSTIATGSIRRQRQLKWKRSDLKVAEVRGNVSTRLRKLRENPAWSGIILAEAGLERLGIVSRTLRQPDLEGELQPSEAWQLDRPRYQFAPLSSEDFLSAGGQGIIALQVRCEDAHTKELLAAIDDRPTHLCLRAEREFLRLLNGDCDSPVGVQARFQPNELRLRAQVFSADEGAPRVGMVTRSDNEPELIASELMTQMYGG
ncbi:MAG TPA: hydroxymethylbilane synthase [Chthoniobacterales bacterium]